LIREWMHETFVAELTAQRRPFRLVSGTLQDRFNRAVECIDEVFARERRRQVVVTA
jgi:nicotinamide riboside kinase